MCKKIDDLKSIVEKQNEFNRETYKFIIYGIEESESKDYQVLHKYLKIDCSKSDLRDIMYMYII